MKARLVLLVVLLHGCVESNPQPSPGQPDIRDWGSIDVVNPSGPDAAPGEDLPPLMEDASAMDQADGVVPDLVDEEVCTPDCMDRECGDDGCGDTCGTCEEIEGWYYDCVEGICVGEKAWGMPCEAPSECWSDLCLETWKGFICVQHCLEECPWDWTCVAYSVDGPDMLFVCIPICPVDCVDKECGEDGCGGLCGECGQGETCNEQAQCVPAATCTPKGEILGQDPCCEGLEPRLQVLQAGADCPAVDGACCYSCQYTEPVTWTCEEPATGLNPCTSHEILCHADPDMDGVPSEADNCPTVPNPTCAEVDGDGIGDDCDPDIDGDGVPNELDCAPWNPAVHPGAANDPWNLIDDDCDGDVDDGSPAAPFPCYDEMIPDVMDNCPLVCNLTQEDLDNDGYGDACDADVDGDGTANEQDCAVYNQEIHPGAAEICNGVDDDCDGAVDEDCPCQGEFASFMDSFPWLLCCPGLVAAQACWPQSGPECEDLTCLFECSCLEPLGFVCVPCGNGICDESETVCTCPEDCVDAI